ncbi:septum formation protein [Caldanaerobius fijiensis DSM 17918]|uniref:dTTP/UTP pyrophosphatase n=1 Tax=Caldanaerobius fijiensis DSM 17918 TaxID=1121256 RepID=A0A1M4Y8U0_9THEO|nr:Maf family protein [Caldanaerobius fijiensis]SHF02224.1 septum formation protein [Caldanaerobius fijiensis DSM 17918]
MVKIILASQSPRRRDLLASLGVDFQTIASNTEENLNTKDPVELVTELSRQKALNVAYQLDYDSIVIGADTIVYVDGNILGKPENEIDAFNKLKLLQGRSHQVYTGICIVKVPSYKIISDYAMTQVWIKSMKDQEIRNYIKTGEVMDKAGAYAIQGRGSLIVEKIEGCYYNVVGLPLNKLNEMLKQLDVDLMCI